MNQIEKILYTGRTHTSGGRAGTARSSDGALDVALSPPGFGNGTNPEQLFAAGWSACFLGAIGAVASKLKVTLPAERTVDAEVDLVMEGEQYSLRARLNVSLPGIARELAEQLVAAAHQTCPYSKATRGNIPVEINVV
ncbi:MAG TPA: organic hydroperoxide resistance protein [Devosia sp.]|jgi:Ohr subfamily peroxiredoxin|uniref:organic hydroperoxide resistance protein n=1 Tax=Devosia sp. TaxID=1871048 RepID=UPI002DDDB962|nr:organic hydroperoxide resistance protein [Devosia sp.]HEV2515347.1 organic hydroperoxide resistance protein [Devosia sp.]